MLGPIQTARAALPHLRAQGGGRLIAVSSVGGLTAGPGGSVHSASTWGVEGFFEALAGEVAPFGIGVTLVEPGGARTGFAQPGLPVLGDPVRMAARIIASADVQPAPLRLVLGSDSHQAITAALRR